MDVITEMLTLGTCVTNFLVAPLSSSGIPLYFIMPSSCLFNMPGHKLLKWKSNHCSQSWLTFILVLRPGQVTGNDVCEFVLFCKRRNIAQSIKKMGNTFQFWYRNIVTVVRVPRTTYPKCLILTCTPYKFAWKLLIVMF